MSGLDPDAPSGPLSAMAPDLAQRITAILAAVEREADRILDEVREQAEHEIEVARRQADGLVAERQRRIAELSDAVVERTEAILERLGEAGAIRDSFERLVQALAEAAERLTREIESEGPGAAREPRRSYFPPPAPVPDRPPVEPRPEPSPAADATGLGDDPRLVQRARHAAIRMAAAGTTRGQVASHLRDSLHLADPGSLLDEVFGPNTADDARVPWAI